MRRAEQSVVVAVERDVQRVAGRPRVARRVHVAAHRSMNSHPAVGRGDRGVDAGAVVADQDVQLGGDEQPRKFKTSSTGWTKRSSSSARSTSTRTIVTPKSCARSSHSSGWTGSLRPTRRSRRRGHPGVRGTCSAACLRPLGAGITRTAAAVPTTVLSGGNRLRRKSLCSNRRNRTGFQPRAAN